MSVPDQIPVSNHTGNGVTTVFPYEFLLFDATDLRVLVDGVPIDLGVDYTVSGIGQSGGGNVTFLSPPAALTAIAFVREVAIQRSTDYQYAGDFNSRTVNRDIDRVVMMIQDSGISLSNALRLPPGDPASGALPFAGARALKTLAFDAEGNLALSAAQGNADILAAQLLSKTSSTGAALIGYKGPGLASVGRPLVEKLAERISVKDFGAKGDGVTNDFTALQAAIDYAANLSPGGSASGCVLYFPPGEYMTSGTLIMPAGKPVFLQGEGDGSKLRRISGSGAIIECRSASVIRQLFFRGPLAGTSNGIFLNGANTARLESCYFQNQTTGVDMALSYAVEFISCVFDVCFSYGISATTSAHNTMVERCNFYTCGVANNGQAVRFGVASDNLGIKDNDFEYCNVNLTINACNSVQITGNYFEYHKAACFDFGAGCQGITIESNWIALGDAVGGGNVAVVQNIAGGRFAHNTIYNQTVNFTVNALVGFDVWLNTKTGTGTLGAAPWNGAILQNSWTPQANYNVAQFIKDSRGWVHLRGSMIGGVAPSVLFNLPAAYRPAAINVFGPQSANGACRITVNPDGNVVATVAPSNNACMDGISFYVG